MPLLSWYIYSLLLILASSYYFILCNFTNAREKNLCSGTTAIDDRTSNATIVAWVCIFSYSNVIYIMEVEDYGHA